jgi:hypothetical protein
MGMPDPQLRQVNTSAALRHFEVSSGRMSSAINHFYIMAQAGEYRNAEAWREAAHNDLDAMLDAYVRANRWSRGDVG